MSDERYSVREERRSRKQLSCAECHRLKLKCDRNVPCSNCVRRECAELCPNSVRIKKSSRDDGGVVNELRERLAAIEGLLAGLGGTLRGGSRSRAASRSRSRSPGSSSRSREASPKRGGRREDERDAYRRREHGERGRYHDRDRSRSRSPQRERYDERVPRERESRKGKEKMDGNAAAARRPAFQDAPPRIEPRVNPSPHAHPHSHSHPHSHPHSHSRHQTTAYRAPGSSAPSTRPPSRDSRHFSFQYDNQERITRTPPGAPHDESSGTLVIDPGGRSKWLGPTAGTEWLKNQEMSDGGTSRRSRSPSPQSPKYFDGESLFPFPSWGPPPTMETMTLHLPPPDEARVLLDAYYDNYTWNHDVAPRRSVQPLFDRVYDTSDPEPPARRIHPQQLALLFIIFAMGALHNPSLPPHDPSAEHFLAAARWCLVKGDFIGHNTIAGLQSVVIMAHYHLETEKGRNGDNAWPLWGLAMRLVTAMGLHRDGARWNLPVDVVEERRHVFWECHTIDVFQANCFSRPSSLRPEHIDTEFPSQNWTDGPGSQKSFRTLKFELCRISGAVLDQAMDVRPTPYAAITSLYDRLCAFERHIPFHLRCRTALLALPSVYADADSATRDSPEVNRGDLHRTFQQFTLALNVSECILFLQRSYFVKALQEAPQDPTRSIYGKSYLAVVERCNVIIEVVAGLYELYPTVTARHWFFWYHLFTAAVCIGTMIIKNSSNPLSGMALAQIDHSIKLYSSVLKDHATPSLVQNHQWLLRLRQRALAKIEHDRSDQNSPRRAEEEEDDEIDIELLGWRTRLVERARHPHRSSTTASVPPGPSSAPALPSLSPSVTAPPPAPIEQVLQQHFAVPSNEANTNVEMSTDLFLHQFWDPTTLLEATSVPSLTNANWWNNFDGQLAGLDPNMMRNMMP